MDDKDTDRRLRRTYGISLGEYNQMLAEQGGCCAICKKPPTGRRLHVDHDHRVQRGKVYPPVKRPDKTWSVVFQTPRADFFVTGLKTRSEAKRIAKDALTRMSVRGALCWQCNTGLQKWRDNPDHLEAAAKYLRKFQTAGSPAKN